MSTYTKTKRKDSIGRRLMAFLMLFVLTLSIGQPIVQAAPWGLSAQITNPTPSATTTMTLAYEPHGTITDQSRISLDYDGSVGLGILDPNTDVLVTGNNITSSVATVDLVENIIDIVITGTADAANPVTIVVNNFQTPGFGGNSTVDLRVYNSGDVETERDYAPYYIQNTSGVLVTPLEFTQSSISMTLLPTTNMQNDWDLEFQFPSFFYIQDITDPDISITSPNITGFTSDYSQLGSNIVRLNLNVTGDTAGQPIEVTMNNVKSAKYETGGFLYVSSFDDTDNYIEQGDPYLTILPDQFTTKTVTLSNYQADTPGVTYSFTLEPHDSYFQQYDRVEVQFNSSPYLGDAVLTSTNPNYTFTNTCATCNPVSFEIDSDAGPASGPLTFTLSNVRTNFQLGTKDIDVRAYIDDNAQGLPDDGSYDGLGYRGNLSYDLTMKTLVYPDSIIPSEQNTHRVFFRPDTDLEDGWQIFLQYNAEADLSNVTAGDVSIFANTPTTVSNVVVDSMAKTILMDVAFYSDTSSGDRLTVNINNIINPGSPGTYPVQVETRDNTIAHNPVDNGTGTYTIAAPFDVPVTVDVPYEQALSPFHLVGFTPSIDIEDEWIMRIVFPNDVDITDVDSSDLTAITTPTNKINSLNNFQKDIGARYIQAQVDMTSGDSEGFAWDVNINDVITPTTAGTYILKVYFFENQNFSYEDENFINESLVMQTQGEGDFLINPGSPPSFTSASPADNATGIGLLPMQTYVLNDVDDGIDTSTLDITSNGLDVYIDGVCQVADFTCQPFVNGPGNQLTIQFRPVAQYPTYTTIPVTIYAEDIGGLTVSRNIDFETGDVIQDPYNLYSNDIVTTAQGGNGSPSSFTGTTPVFSAQYYDNNGVDLTHYEIEVSSDPTFTDPSPTVMLVDSGKKSVDDVDAFTSGALDHLAFDAFGGRLPDIQIDPTNPYVKGTTYYWRIRYWEESQYGNFSTDWADAEFILLDNPYLISATPANTAFNVNVATNQLTYVYDDDGDGMDTNGVYLYIEYFDTVNSVYHYDPLIENSVCNPTFTTSCSITDIGNGQIEIIANLVDPLLPSTTYYTYPSAQDLAANYTNNTLYFSTPYPPDAPQNLHANTAANGTATDFTSPATVPGTDVVFGGMHQSSYGAPADFYTIIVDNNSDFSSPECNTGKVTTGAPVANGGRLDDIVVPACTFVDGQTYYWRMSFWNDNLQGPFTDAEFTVASAGDTNAPGITRTPANSATNVPRNQSFEVVITDAEAQVDLSTVNITIDGDPVVVGGVLDGDYTFTQSPVGNAGTVTYQFTRNNPTLYTYGSTVNFVVQAEDTNNNAVGAGQQTTSFTFEAAPPVDTNAPSILTTPTNGATNVPKTQSFVVTITDGEAQVDRSTVNITIAGDPVVVNGVLDADYTFAQSPVGNAPSLTYQFTRNDTSLFADGTTSSFEINARDTNNNLATSNLSFTFATTAPVTNVSGGGGGGGGYNSDYINQNSSNTNAPVQNTNTNAPVPQPQQNTNNSIPVEPERPTAPEENLATCEFFASQVGNQDYGDINDAILNNYASYLLDHGIILGRNTTEFGSNDSMTRSEVLRSIVQANCKKFSLEPVTRAPFPDVQPDHKDSLYIDAAKRAGIVSGYKADGTYKPDRFISRAEAVKVVFQEVLGEDVAIFDGKTQPFGDISSDEWYVNYIRFGVEVGILKDNDTHTFDPHNAITREDITKLLVDTLRYKEKLENPNRPAAPIEGESESGVDKLDPSKMVNIADTIKEPTPACSYFEVRRVTPDYKDLDQNKNMMDYAARLLTYGVVVGKDAGTFSVLDEVTRSEILRIMIQANCKDYVLEPVTTKPFPDVPLLHKDAMFIQAAKTASIISGYGDGTFRPDNKINRAEILKILLEAALNKTFSRFDGALVSYVDVPNDAWYARYLRFMTTQKILNEEGAQFKPEDNGNRGFIASTLLKILEFRDKLMR